MKSSEKNYKKMGIILITAPFLSIILIILAYSIVSFIGTTTASDTAVADYVLGLLGLLAVISIFICLPLGIVYLIKRKSSEPTKYDEHSGKGDQSEIPEEIRKCNQSSMNDSPLKKKRPIGVWVILLYHLFSISLTLLSFVLIYGGRIPLNEMQQAYFNSIGTIDLVLTACITILGLSAAITLFLLKRVSAPLFGFALALNLIYTIIHALQTSWTQVVGGSGLIGMAMGYGILIVFILYARNLAKKSILS